MRNVFAISALLLSLHLHSSAAALERGSGELDIKGRGAISISYRTDMLGCFSVKNAEFTFKDKVGMSFDFAAIGGDEKNSAASSACTCPLGDGSTRSMIFVVFPYPSNASEKQNVTSFGSPTVGKLVNVSRTNPFLPASGDSAALSPVPPERETLWFPLATIGGKLARRYRVDWQCSFPAFKKRS